MKMRLFIALLLSYIVCVWAYIEATNTVLHFILPTNTEGQEGDRGVGKMRGAAREFQTMLLLFGTWVYPACIVAAVLLVWQSLKTPDIRRKGFGFALVALPLGVLMRFLFLGVFSAGFS